MSSRKSLSKKLRFEVFKRDSFTCQYCGKVAPNVILEVDHIDPVSKGGNNYLLNLITSCFDCNRGKTNSELSDDSVVAKQRQQLELLQERREQIQLMFDWRKELDNLQSDTNDMVVSYIEDKIENFSLNESGKKRIPPLTKKYELADILESIDLSASKYLRYGNDGNLRQESAEEFLNKIGGILANKNKPLIDQKASYIKGICRNRFNYWNPQTGSILLNNYIKALRDYGWSEEQILDDLENEVIPKTKESKSWTEWKTLLDKWTEDVNGWERSGTESTLDEINSEALDECVKTHYNGHIFRSCLEARWAVFFDNYGIDYEYLLEEIVLNNGNRYLPDFFIRSLGIYAEVKPDKGYSLSELKIIEDFALGCDTNLLLIMGFPTKEEIVLINRCSASPLYEYINEDNLIEESELISEYIQNLTDFSLVEFGRNPINNSLALVYKGRCPPDEMSFKKSILKAKDAVFEHAG